MQTKRVHYVSVTQKSMCSLLVIRREKIPRDHHDLSRGCFRQKWMLCWALTLLTMVMSSVMWRQDMQYFWLLLNSKYSLGLWDQTHYGHTGSSLSLPRMPTIFLQHTVFIFISDQMRTQGESRASWNPTRHHEILCGDVKGCPLIVLAFGRSRGSKAEQGFQRDSLAPWEHSLCKGSTMYVHLAAVAGALARPSTSRSTSAASQTAACATYWARTARPLKPSPAWSTTTPAMLCPSGVPTTWLCCTPCRVSGPRLLTSSCEALWVGGWVCVCVLLVCVGGCD